MLQDAEWDAETVTFETSDGVTLTGELATPVDAGRIDSAAIVCHPHPQYGGNRFNSVVDACWRALADAGIVALRFDFRPEFGGGVDERLDAVAALDVLAARHPNARLVALGYSFGAMVVLGVTDHRIAATVLVAPPLSMMPVEVTPLAQTLVLTPVGDQFTPPDAATPIVDGWRSSNDDVTFEPVPMADHFLAGRTAHVADRVVTWLTTLPEV